MFKEIWYHPEEDKIVEIIFDPYDSMYAILDNTGILCFLPRYGFIQSTGYVYIGNL